MEFSAPSIRNEDEIKKFESTEIMIDAQKVRNLLWEKSLYLFYLSYKVKFF